MFNFSIPRPLRYPIIVLAMTLLSCINLVITILLSKHTFAVSTDTTASLTIASPKISATGQPGEVIYLSSNITVNADNIDSYTLSISGNPNITGLTTISGTDNTIPANMADNTWGYSYGATDFNNSTTVYHAIDNTPTIIDNAEVINNAVSFTKKLTFAAKFAKTASPGHYAAKVNLQLVATPKHVSGLGSWTLPTGNTIDSGINDMQDIKSGFCLSNSNIPNGSSITLQDSRDKTNYEIRKMETGQCWMNTNLTITGSRTLTSEDSDVTNNFTLPASSLSSFTTSYTIAGVYQTDISLAGPTGYYTWCAATAGTCTNVATTNATGSICPKGWKMPTKDEYTNLVSAIGNTTKLREYGFEYTGRVYDGDIAYQTTAGNYWSRTGNGSTTAYDLYVNSAALRSDERNRGYAVRCIAQY